MKPHKYGVLPGKFFPPHFGHLYVISQCLQSCDFLAIVISDNMDRANRICKELDLPPMPLNLRREWLLEETQLVIPVSVYTMDETNIAPYPDGSPIWCKKLQRTVGREFDVVFGSEKEYADTYRRHLPGVKYKMFDRVIEMSSTQIRKDIKNNILSIVSSARSFFWRSLL